MDQTLSYLTAVLALGITAQLLAWRLGLPSILFLLAFGFAAGELWMRPDQIIAESLLFPVVSLSVAIILFEGGLSLKLKELKEAGTPVLRLCTWGVVVSWLLTTLIGRFILGFEWGIASLLGAILVVTGPTVIAPLLRVIQPSPRVASIVKWEGIVIDPIGATFALLVFEVVSAVSLKVAALDVVLTLGKTIAVGVIFGYVAGWVVTRLLERYAIPDYLHSVFLLVVVAVLFTASDALQHEAGLLTVTIFGIYLANQDRARVRHIIEFKENLRVLLISTLFIVLSGRVSWEQIAELGWRAPVFTLGLILLVRPVSVFLSMWNTRLPTNEKILLSALAPRGIVAAAVTSVFALKLLKTADEADPSAALFVQQANQLVPVVFTVIVGTVAIYGVLAKPIARRLKLASRNRVGILFAGASAWVRQLAKTLQEEGVNVLLVDTNQENVKQARLAGLNATRGNIVSESVVEELNLAGIGRLLAVTPNDESNSLAAHEFSHRFGRRNIFQLSTEDKPDKLERDHMSQDFQARYPFEGMPSFAHIETLHERGFVFKKTRVSEQFGEAEFRRLYGEEAVVMFMIETDGESLHFITPNRPCEWKEGQKVLALVPPVETAAAD